MPRERSHYTVSEASRAWRLPAEVVHGLAAHGLPRNAVATDENGQLVIRGDVVEEYRPSRGRFYALSEPHTLNPSIDLEHSFDADEFGDLIDESDRVRAVMGEHLLGASGEGT